ncbi:hypothetical protein NNO_1509 [Hydrogenimonas sp.]|nr:hypothetical protein NNO_1509 [Hydrogenimonas sp.]
MKEKIIGRNRDITKEEKELIDSRLTALDPFSSMDYLEILGFSEFDDLLDYVRAFGEFPMPEDFRMYIAGKYCYYLPLDTNLEKIQKLVEKYHDAGKYILDVGAGSGLMLGMLAKRLPHLKNRLLGIRMEGSPYGVDSISLFDNIIDCSFEDFIQTYDLVDEIDTIILSWPPYLEPLAHDVLKYFSEHDTISNLIYIGEDRHGCTGDDTFFDLWDDLKEKGRIVSKRFRLEIFYGMYDFLHLIRDANGR